MKHAIIFLLICLCGCTRFMPNQDHLAKEVISAAQTEYVAIEPIPTSAFVADVIARADSTSCTTPKEEQTTVYWKTLSTKQINDKLSIEESVSTISKVNLDGSLTVLNSKFSGERGRYTVTFDYAKFTYLFYGDSNSTDWEDGWFRVGVGVRLISDVTTMKNNVDLGSIMAVSSAIKNGDVTGSMRILKIGINSKSLNMIIPPPTDISDATLQVAMQAMTTIRAQLYDEETVLTPHKIAKRRSPAW